MCGLDLPLKVLRGFELKVLAVEKVRYLIENESGIFQDVELLQKCSIHSRRS